MARAEAYSVARNRQLTRTWRLLALLRVGAGCSLQRLAGDLGATTRTIYRDLVALQKAGIPIYDERLDDGVKRWRLVKGTPCPICGKGTLKGAELRRELSANAAVTHPVLQEQH